MTQHYIASMPTYLCHYTTVETLAMILKTRSIRLCALSSMDDMQEGRCIDAVNYGRFVFVSAWTEELEESIPMWNMYAKMERGVRIKLPVLPFKEFDFDKSFDAEEFPGVNWNDNIKKLFPTRVLINMPYVPLPYTKTGLLHKVVYTSDRNLLEPQVLFTDGKSNTYNLNNLGIYKNKSWEFQKEWRYKICLNPVSFRELYQSIDKARELLNSRMLNDLYPLPTNGIYLTIDDIAYMQMEVTLNPKISDGSQTIVELLKKEYNPSMRIVESALSNTIR